MPSAIIMITNGFYKQPICEKTKAANITHDIIRDVKNLYWAQYDTLDTNIIFHTH